MRASSSGPRSLTVARTGWPCSPNTSHKVTGKAANSGVGSLRSAMILPSLSPSVPACEMPVRSPLTSAMNTGTPAREKASARVCSVMVLPVPVAPVIRPCRLALSGCRQHRMSSRCAITKGSVMRVPEKYNRASRLTKFSKDSAWQDTANGPIFSTARGGRMKKEAKSGPVSSAKSWSPPALGGGDLGINPRLRLAVEKAKAANLPIDTVKRNIDKATGNLEGVSYEEIRYEGYGIGGAAIIVDTMTDNRVRTVAEVRHAFSKYGGNMGTEGSVAFQFKHCGQLVYAPGTDEEKLMEAALEAGADDVIVDDDGAIEVLTRAGRVRSGADRTRRRRLQGRGGRGHDARRYADRTRRRRCRPHAETAGCARGPGRCPGGLPQRRAMKVLVVGGGGREHALAWKLAQSQPGRDGVCGAGQWRHGAGRAHAQRAPSPIWPQLCDWAVAEKIGLTVVGPEGPLAAGIVDLFRDHGLRVFGPTRAAAQLESSKAFSKAFMQRHGIPTAAHATFSDRAQAHAYVDAQGAPIVVKADGLAAGKGVVVAETLEQAHAAIDQMLPAVADDAHPGRDRAVPARRGSQLHRLV